MRNYRITESLNHRNEISTNHSVIRLFSDSVIRQSRRGFTLIEMLVVIAIIAVLTAAGLIGYGGAIKAAQRARGNEIVHDFQVALTMALQQEDEWPRPILAEGSKGDGLATAEVGAWLGKHGLYAFGTILNPEEKDVAKKRLQVSQAEEFGVLTPWGEAVAKKLVASGTLSPGTRVPSGGTINDHILRFAVDDDLDGITKVGHAATGSGSKSSKEVRASACVWCCGFDGKFGTKDDICSWAEGQEVQK